MQPGLRFLCRCHRNRSNPRPAVENPASSPPGESAGWRAGLAAWLAASTRLLSWTERGCGKGFKGLLTW